MKKFLSICVLAITCCSFSIFAQEQKTEEAKLLQSNQTVERELSSGQTHKYSIDLQTNNFLHIKAEQKGIDLVIKLFDSKQNQVSEMDSPNGTKGFEELIFVTNEDGKYEIQISPLEKEAKAGKYTLQWTSRLIKNKADNQSLAETLFKQGQKTIGQLSTANFQLALRIYEKLGDRKNQIECLLALADKSDYSQKARYYNQALLLSKADQDKNSEAHILTLLAKPLAFYSDILPRSKDNKDKVIKAIEYYNEALNIYRHINNKKEAAAVLKNLAELFNYLGDKQKAQYYYKQSASIYKIIGDKRKEAELLVTIGYIHENEQKFIDYCQQAISIYKSLGDKLNEAQLLTKIGSYFHSRNKEDYWIDYYNQALSVYKSISNKEYLLDNEDEFRILESFAKFFSKSDDYQKALSYYIQALSILEATDNAQKEVDDEILKKQGLVRVGNDSCNFYPNSYEKRTILENIASLYDKLGNEKKKSEYLNQVILLYGSTNENNSDEIDCIQKKASAYLTKKDFQKALQLLNQSLPYLRAKGEKYREIIALIEISRVYGELGDETKMVDYENQVLALSNNSESEKDKRSTLWTIALNNHKLGYHQKALELYYKALNLNGDKSPSILSGIGDVYAALREKQKAIDFYKQAIWVYKDLGHKFREASLLESIGNVYFSSKEYQQAIDYYTQALQMYKANGRKQAVAEILSSIMSTSQLQANSNLAIIYGKQSVNTYQEIRQSIQRLDKETQETYAKKIEPTYRKLADILISEGRFPEAQAVLDLLKEEEFKQIVRRSSKEPIYTLPYTKAEEEALKIVDKLALLGKELSDLKAKPKESLTAEETKRFNELEFTEIPAANRALKQATEALSTVAPDVKNALDLKMKENIQTILPTLGRNVVALYTVVGKTNADDVEGKITNNKVNIGWVLLVTSEFRKAYPIDTNNLEQTVFKFRESLRSPNYDPQPLAEELYKKLFRQTSPKLNRTLEQDLEETLGQHKDKTLMWSLDGVLRYIPISALHDGKQYLVEKYRNTVFNTASLGSLKDSVKQNWEITGLGVSMEGTVKSADGAILKFSALKGSEAELNSIVKEKNRAEDKDGVFPGTLKINQEFTKEALFEGARNKTPVIHISSHFWFNPVKEETSFLLLGNGGKIEMTEFEDYPNLFQDVDFLSLSACDTATGTAANFSDTAKETNGKEVEGFAYKAQTLGAKSVLASLWQVSDKGTKELMLQFYKIRKQQPELTKAEALRQAQLSLLSGTIKSEENSTEDRGMELIRVESGLTKYKKDAAKPFAHPYYWSPFILIGNWK